MDAGKDFSSFPRVSTAKLDEASADWRRDGIFGKEGKPPRPLVYFEHGHVSGVLVRDEKEAAGGVYLEMAGA